MRRGFTIVELLIVIVVIAILAAVVIVAYSGLQRNAQVSKIQNDTKQLTKAVVIARELSGSTLLGLTGNAWTADACYSQPDDTDLAALPDTHQCWVDYNHALDVISQASGSNVRNLKDPWNRPYYIDENENEDPFSPCQEDIIASYSHPFLNYGPTLHVQYVPLSLSEASC